MKEKLASACRVLAHHGMIDLWGHLSLRVPGGDAVLVTPRFSRACLPRTIAASQVLVAGLAGERREGQGELPAQFDTDLALYRSGGERTACAFAAPRYAMAAGIAGYSLKPLTHMESSVSYDLAFEDGNAAEKLQTAAAVHQPGVGVWAAGKDVFDCLSALYHLEYLAQANAVIAGDAGMRGIPREDSDRLWRQFSGHHHYHEFFASLDPGPLRHPYEGFVSAHGEGLKTAIAFSCRALWERRTLVAFLEHVSHRLPGENRFLMSASKSFRDMEPQDCCLLDLDANWLGGPKPPGFKWFHAQLLSERRDVQAVVHTHDLYGRVYALSARKLAPSYRVGLDIATRELPLYSRCDLIVDPEVRRQTLDALAAGPLVHEIGHGTDFVADSLEQSTVAAIQREAFLEMDHLARQFGGAKSLPDRVVRAIRNNEASAEDWWWFYAAEVGAPKRSTAGL